MHFNLKPPAGRSRRRRLIRFFFGSYSAASFTWRVLMDASFIAVGVAIAISNVGELRPGITVVATAALIAGPVLIVTGTYGFMGTPRRLHQLARLGAGLLLGAAAESLILVSVSTEAVVVAGVALGWLLGGMLSVLARLAKGRFEDRFRVLPRSVGPADRPVRHVLLIGGAGYLGSSLARQLLDRGYHVTVLDRLVFGDIGVRGLESHPRFRLVKDDFRNVEALVLAARGADAVIHLGAIVGDPACAIHPEKAVDVNYRATRLIRNVCRGLGVQRLLFASTCSVYGVNDRIIDEESDLNPVSVYAASKIASERAVLEESENGIASTVLRLATVFGWSPRPRFDLVVNLLTARATLEGEIDIINAHQWRPFISVSDVARAFITCLEAPVELVRSQTFNVGDDDLNLTLGELSGIFSELFPDVKVNERINDSDPRSYHVSFDRIRQTLGYRCQTTVAEGIEQLRRMIIETNIKDYTDPQFSNVKVMREHPDLVFGPDEDEADPEIGLLRSLYESPERSKIAQ